jgi:hypothetical protein
LTDTAAGDDPAARAALPTTRPTASAMLVPREYHFIPTLSLKSRGRPSQPTQPPVGVIHPMATPAPQEETMKNSLIPARVTGANSSPQDIPRQNPIRPATYRTSQQKRRRVSGVRWVRVGWLQQSRSAPCRAGSTWEAHVILIGAILFIIGLIAGIYLLWVVGLLLLVVGVVMALLGRSGRPVGGRSHWF